MKLNKILLAFALILATAYYFLDKQLFYYGKNDLGLYTLQPLKLTPQFHYDFEGGFCIVDSIDLTIIGRGFKYRSNDSVEIRDILSYGFNNESLIALIDATNDRKYYILCTKNDGYKINVLKWDNSVNESKYKWVKLKNNEKHIRTIELSRNYSMFAFIILIFVFTYRVVKTRKNKKNG